MCACIQHNTDDDDDDDDVRCRIRTYLNASKNQIETTNKW